MFFRLKGIETKTMKISFVLLFALTVCAITLISTGCERGVEIIKPIAEDYQNFTGMDDVEVMDTGDISGHVPEMPIFVPDEETEEQE